ncbi:hypothetical protein [Metarhizobium album]|uniref:hypothetical protein n=1 Tax=Metarhizobium album TaxID=2182425 RepID=UPI000FFEA6EF|nr:hypothetical protein [Rhizobium album]
MATKSMTYATRRLMAGDSFETQRDRDARILIAIRKARPAGEEEVIAESEPAIGAGNHDLDSARAAYEAALGKKPFHAWDAATLREKIAASQQGA